MSELRMEDSWTSEEKGWVIQKKNSVEIGA
jgi:hypothetical protein